MKCKSFNNKLGIIVKGKYKDSFCIILKESSYIKSEKLYWYTVYKDNIIFKISKNSVNVI